jgi:hypothetical protein
LGWGEVASADPKPDGPKVGPAEKNGGGDLGRNEIADEIAREAWRAIGKSNNTPKWNSTTNEAAKKAVEDWDREPKTKGDLLPKEDGEPLKWGPPPWFIEAWSHLQRVGQAFKDRAEHVTDQVTLAFEDPDGWPKVAQKLKIVLEPFVGGESPRDTPALFLVRPPTDPEAKAFADFVRVITDPEGFFRQAQEGDSQRGAPDCFSRARRWEDVIRERIKVLEEISETMRFIGLGSGKQKQKWIEQLRDRYRDILDRLQSESRRFKESQGLGTNPAERDYARGLKNETDKVAARLGLINLTLDGEQVKMEDLWPAYAGVMPAEFQSRPVGEVLEELSTRLKKVITQLEDKIKSQKTETGP